MQESNHGTLETIGKKVVAVHRSEVIGLTEVSTG